MRGVVRAFVAVWAASQALAWGAQSLGLQGSRPYDGRGDDEATARIEWRESWDASLKANLERWEAEIRKLAPDERERALRLRMRAVRLLEALIERYPNETEKRRAALQEIAGNCYACGLPARGNYALKRLIEEMPGQVEFVVAALHRILVEAKWEAPWEVEEGMAWIEFAAPRLVALHRAGSVPDRHSAIITAWRALAVLRRAQQRLLEAWQALEALEAHTGRDDWWQTEEADLLFAAGRERDALPRFQDLYARSEENWRARDRIHQILGDAYPAPPTFACHFGIETQWEAIRISPVADVADRIAGVLKADAEGKNLLPWRDARHVSVWAMLDHHLLAQEPAALAALRQAQDDAARGAATPDAARSPARLAELCRWYPWAAATHRAALDGGEALLREGHAGLALRFCQDVLAHTSAPGLRAQAQVGAWLALAQDGDAAALPGAAASAPADLPWLGAAQPAKAILERLGAAPRPADAAAGAPLAELDRRLLRLPPVGLWPPELFADVMPRELAASLWARVVRPQAADAGLLVAGPELLAWFRDDPARPAWTRTPCLSKGKQGRQEVSDAEQLVVPGPFQPAITDGRVYTRWGLDPTRRFLTDVAAFDLASGELLWSTAGDPAWDGLWPAGDPAAAEGRVYVLAVRAGYASALPVTTATLVCLDAERGQVAWRRPLGTQSVTLMPSSSSGYREYRFDLAHYGNAVAVHRGAIYCQTNLGFAARCDARDGLVEWVATYPRVQLRWNARSVLLRQGSAPLVCGDRVVFLPRDGAGAFALDGATGKLVWDSPFAPAAEAVGLAEGLVVITDGHALVALDGATGQPRWHRHFAEDLVGRPCLIGSAIYAGTASQLVRLEAATGRVLDAGDWGKAQPPGPFAIRGRALAAVTEGAIGSDRQPVGKPLDPQAPASAGPLRLPLARAWKLERPNPTLWTPPPEAKLDGKLLVLSQGVLECVRATPQGGIEWQRVLRPGWRGIAWTEKTLLLIYPSAVTAIDTTNGRLRWETEVPFTIRQWQEAPPCLALGDFTEGDRGKRTCALDLASGKLLWARDFSELGDHYNNHFHGIGWDGKSLHLLATLAHYPGGGHHDVVCDPADGHITAIRPFLPRGRDWPGLFDVGEGFGFYVSQDRVAWDFTLDAQTPHTRYNANLHDLNAQSYKLLRRTRTRRRLQKSEQWIQIYQYEDYPHFRHTHWILHRGDPAYELRRPRQGVIRGDRLYEVDEQSLRLVDLPARKEAARLPIVLRPNLHARILDYCEDGDKTFVVSGLERGPTYALELDRVQVDVFETATGRPLARQVLNDVPYWRFGIRRDWRDHVQHRTQVAWDAGTLFVTDADGLNAFSAAPAAPEGLPEAALHVVHRAAAPIRMDGSLDDWAAQAAIPIQGPGGRSATLQLAHDGANLYLALRYPSAVARARQGRGSYGGGNWLELTLTVGGRTEHWGIGADDRSRVAWETLDEGGAPRDARGAVSYDFLRGHAVYELAAPVRELARLLEAGRGPRLGLSLAAWEDLPGSGPTRVATWGDAWRGPALLPDLHERIYVHPLTRDGEEAGLAIAHELPELDEAWDFFERSCAVRAGRRTSQAVVERYRDYLKRHRNGPAAERALVALDLALRDDVETDPSSEVLRIAQEAGVADDVRNSYARIAKCCLSQWLHIDPKKPPDALMLQLHDGRETKGWEHRVVWGADAWRDWGEPGTASHRYAGPVPRQEGWVELRIPLIWLGMHDRAIHGVSFMQHGGGRVTWDRSALVFDGRERVFLDDEPPKGTVEGSWSWVAEPRKSGARAHTDADPGGSDDTRRRTITRLEAPLYEHLAPPAGGAILSQWIHIDPAKPPRAVAITLQSRGEPVRALWGQAIHEGRYIGPLPKAGEWQELRLPLDWTPAHCWPIRGMAFEQDGGSVVWDRTAVVRGGQEFVLIDDEMPYGSTRNDWKWVEAPVKSGKKAHTLPYVPERHDGHGVAYLRQPFTQHMPFEPARMSLVLKEHIPRLGPSEEAWNFFEVPYDLAPLIAQRQSDQCLWLLATFPDHPKALSILKKLLDLYRSAKEPEPLRAVEAAMDRCGVARGVRAAFRRHYGTAEPSFIRSWRVLGPFPNPKGQGIAKPFPPETAEVQLAADYEVLGGKARWKFHAAPTDYVDLAKLFQPNEHVVAYAVCWVHTARARPVSLEAGSDDGMRLWVNRKLVLDRPLERSATPRQDSVPAQLRAGWNEILVKVEQGIKDWGFYLELLDADARGLLGEVTLATTPPPPGSTPAAK